MGRVDVTTSDEANFRKLLAGRIDLFPMDPLVGMAMIDQWMTPAEAKELTFAPKPFKSSCYHVLFNEEEPEYPNRKLARIGHSLGTEEISGSESKKGRPVSD